MRADPTDEVTVSEGRTGAGWLVGNCTVHVPEREFV